MLSRNVINCLLPSGSFWEPSAGDDYDLFLDGIADNSEAVRIDLQKLAWLRDPIRTPLLSDLEREYGVIPATLSTEAERRTRLKSVMFDRSKPPTAANLQQKLRDAGFDGVFIYANDPPVDPNIFLAQAFSLMCGDLLPSGNDGQCGEAEAQCSVTGGTLLVNGDLFENYPNYINQCDNAIYCGDDVYAGDLSGYLTVLAQASYTVPVNPGYWPLVFYVGGAATFDPVTGELLTIESYGVPSTRRSEFQRIILRHKPLGTWCAAIIVYN